MAQDLALDRIALQDVMLSYAAGVDERDFDLYRSCFADDVEVFGFGDETVHGAEAWLAYVKNALERFGPTQHMLGPQLASVDGDNAHCRTDVQALHYLKEPEGSTLTLWATYKSDMRRIDGRWRIVRHELVSRGTKVE
ncbi:MAG: nuclear transport factor 2 family protein [Gammaproteobacteria bacterium]|nr:nuclear transport factor 2 family protein [Gammaproteobacteria bacterium]MCY3788057.1 nuclear transport factor 2 family protein [Gemmatimonadota bacterium]